jgi:hypothetical protein
MSTNNSSIDTNIDSYSDDELYEILDLDTDASVDEISDRTNELYNRFLSENNYDMAYFFQAVQNKLLENEDDDSEDDDSEDDDSDDDNSKPLPADNNADNDNDNESSDDNYDSNSVQNNESTQFGNWWENQYIEQTADVKQEDKTTDRKQKVDVFNQGDHIIMKQNELGVNNDYTVPIAQGTMNPNLKNITQRIICIDSKYRANIVPYTNNPDGVSSSTNFTLDLSDPLKNTLTLKLYSIQIPYSWYLIDTNYESDFFFIKNGDNYTCIKIDDGNYTPEELIEEINSKLQQTKERDIDYSYIEFSYASKNGKVTITNTAQTPAQYPEIIFYAENLSCGDKIGCFKNKKINNTLGWILGFRGYVDSEGNMNYGYELRDSPITSESIIDTYGSKYFLLVVDDFNQNHLNKGLVSITNLNNTLSLPNYYNTDLSFNVAQCIKDKKAPIVISAPRRITQAQIYSLNEIINNRKNTSTTSTAPTTTDVLAIVPIKKEGLVTGQQFVEYGSTLQLNMRTYFGPVDVERLKVRLVNDNGFTVNLNGGDWSFSLISENLYQY